MTRLRTVLSRRSRRTSHLPHPMPVAKHDELLYLQRTQR